MVSFIKSFLALFFGFWACLLVMGWAERHPVVTLCLLIPGLVWAVRYEIKMEAKRK